MPPRNLVSATVRRNVRKLAAAGNKNFAQIGRAIGISRTTVRRILRQEEATSDRAALAKSRQQRGRALSAAVFHRVPEYECPTCHRVTIYTPCVFCAAKDPTTRKCC